MTKIDLFFPTSDKLPTKEFEINVPNIPNVGDYINMENPHSTEIIIAEVITVIFQTNPTENTKVVVSIINDCLNNITPTKTRSDLIEQELSLRLGDKSARQFINKFTVAFDNLEKAIINNNKAELTQIGWSIYEIADNEKEGSFLLFAARDLVRKTCSDEATSILGPEWHQIGSWLN